MSGQVMVAQPAPVVGDFEGNTRLIRTLLANQPKTLDGQTLSWQIPRNGFLRGINIVINATITGAPGTPNPSGMAACIRQIKLSQNGGNVIFDMSGPGYHYGLRSMMELGQDIGAHAVAARNAVAAGANQRLDVYIPITPNLRDAVGLLNLQTEQNTYNLDIVFNTDAVIGGTVAVCTAPTVQPMLELFTVPNNEADYPADDMIQRILEESVVYTGAIEHSYSPIRGDIYLQMMHLIGGDLVTAVDNFSTASLLFNQSSYVQTATPAQLDGIRAHEGLTPRRPGTILYDLMASAGLGNYDRMRDVIDSKKVSDFQSRFTLTTTPVTVRHIRRMLARIG